MPPAHKSASSEARKARDKELEIRRTRGQISCAECRRLKLKCDKKVPCSSCVRRGCQTICPNGSLSAGHGTRFVLADTDKLHAKLLEMSNRIRQLEDALQIAHAAISSRQHPLLADDLLNIKTGLDLQNPDEEKEEKSDDNDELDDELMGSFDTLTISEKGEARFFGRTGTEALIVNDPDPQFSEMESDAPSAPSQLPPQLGELSKSFPYGPLELPKNELLRLIEMHLPSKERASALTEAYLENLSWFFRPVNREQILEELIPSVYRNLRGQSRTSISFLSGNEPPGSGQGPDEHVLAALLMVFAIGAVADLTLVPFNDEAELYYHLARAAITLKPPQEMPTLPAVQAVCLMGAYDLFSCRKLTLEGSWNMLSFGMVLAASIGLHRDPARWELDEKSIQRRRSLFWELYAIDHWKSLGSGRPTIFNPRIVDCEYPSDTNAALDDDGTEIPSFWWWKHRFIHDVLSQVADKLGSAKSLKYSEILELDQKVREFGPYRLYERSSSDFESEGATIYLQRNMMGILKDIALLFIHRNFFARAMLEDPDNFPMRSKFAPSFLSAYRSATTLLRVIRENYNDVSHLMVRLWPIWAHALTASVILGSVAARGRSSALAPQAFVEFNLAIEFFEKAQIHPVIKGGLPLLLRLREKAHVALYRYHAEAGRRFGIPPPIARPPIIVKQSSRDDIKVMGGVSRLLTPPWEAQPAATTVPTVEHQVISLPSPSESHTTFSGNELSSLSAVSPTSTLSTDTSSMSGGFKAGSSSAPSRGALNQIAPSGRRSRDSTSPPSTLDSVPEAGPIQSRSDSDWMDPSLFGVQQADFSTMMGLGTAAQYPTATAFESMGQSGLNQSGLMNTGSLNATIPPDPSNMTSGGFSLDTLPSLQPSAMMNVDFDISADMRSGVYDESLLPLQMGEDATVAEAWRTFFQDSRFFNHDSFNS